MDNIITTISQNQITTSIKENNFKTDFYSTQGPAGIPGKSSYQIYIDNGGTLSEEDWLNSFVNIYNTIVTGETPNGNIDGINLNYSISNTPSNNSVKLNLNGMRLKIGDDYLLSSNIITFASAPIPGDTILVDYIK